MAAPTPNKQTATASPIPSVNLPKGGGVLQGNGEKFSANPSTGAAALSVPIALTPGRQGFGPSLSLTYNSSQGNGSFGLGWSLSLPSISRKTSKGLPRYLDHQESDVFLFSDAEDLVPKLADDGSRHVDTTRLPGYALHGYLCRIEGTFSRIERCSSLTDPDDVHWRVLSPDNVLALFGTTPESRIRDPSDHSRIASWLLAESRDCFGNAVVYRYREENGDGCDVTEQHQRNRGGVDDLRRKANRYLKSIQYGNRHSLLDQDGNRPQLLSRSQLDAVEWLFEVVLDYGEHHLSDPQPTDAGQWTYRTDCFSNYRYGFEVRHCRLCTRVLMFHHFPELSSRKLVSSTDFTYKSGGSQPGSPPGIYTFLARVSRSGYKAKQGDLSGYLQETMPPLEFEYSQPDINGNVHALDGESLEGHDSRFLPGNSHWIDLYGEGIAGLLAPDGGGGWRYQRNLSPISHIKDKQTGELKPFFASTEDIQLFPNDATGALPQLMDSFGDGRQNALVASDRTFGFHSINEKESWDAFSPYVTTLNVRLDDPGLRFVDMDGDGIPDIVYTDSALWYTSLGDEIRHPVSIPEYNDEEKGPHHVLTTKDDSFFLADMTGDGLTDLVSMDNCVFLDNSDHFDHRRVLLADIDGTGTADMIYLDTKGVKVFLNSCGNRWSDAILLHVVPSTTEVCSFSTIDLFGTGTTCLVVARPDASGLAPTVQYVDLLNSRKPHLLTQIQNNLGAVTEANYSTSTKFYLQDRLDGKPWLAKLPFPVHVVQSLIVRDEISRNVFTTRYAYHHGYYDIVEREFRGFGMVEQWDWDDISSVTEMPLSGQAATNTSSAHQLAPTYTKSWFHSGLFLAGEPASLHYQQEYFQDAGAAPGLGPAHLPDSSLPQGLDGDDLFEAARSLRGRLLRQEVYCDDGVTPETVTRSFIPYLISESNFAVAVVQKKRFNRTAVFTSYPLESLSLCSERNSTDTRINHTLTLEVDEFNNSKRQLIIEYGRFTRDDSLPTDFDRDVQSKRTITYVTEQRTTKIDNTVEFPYAYRLPMTCETATYDLTGFDFETNGKLATVEYWTLDDFRVLQNSQTIGYEDEPLLSRPEKKLLALERTIFKKDDLSARLPLATTDTLGLVGERYSLALTESMLKKHLQHNGQQLLPDFAAVLTSTGASGGGYILGESLRAAGIFPNDDNSNGSGYWIPSGESFFREADGASPPNSALELAAARANFFIPRSYRTPFGAVSTVVYDDYNIMPRPGSGNPTEEGDSLLGVPLEVDEAALLTHLAAPTDREQIYLGQATTRYMYDYFAFMRTRNTSSPQPVVSYSMSRVTHTSDLATGEQSEIIHKFGYTDGFGKLIQSKSQSRPGPPVMGLDNVSPRWIVSGWIIVNNKGLPVRQFEPFFSDQTQFEFQVRAGVSPVMFYDALGRPATTIAPNGAWTKIVHDPWSTATFDGNSTIRDDPRTDLDVRGIVKPYFDSLEEDGFSFKTWYQRRIDGSMGTEEKTAAQLSEAHANTPTVTYLDSRGAAFLTTKTVRVSCDGHPLDGSETVLRTRSIRDPLGRVVESYDSTDSSGTGTDQLGRVVIRTAFDMMGNALYDNGMEKGESWALRNITGSTIYAWTDSGIQSRFEFDKAGRPTRTIVQGDPLDPNGGSAAKEVTRIIYGESHWEAEDRNLRGEIFAIMDQAGVATNERFSFQGFGLEKTHRICSEYRATVNWSSASRAIPTDPSELLTEQSFENALRPFVLPERYTTSSQFDAIGRPTTIISPHSDTMQPSTIRARHVVTSLLDLSCNLQNEQEGGAPNWVPIVKATEEDAKGRRTLVKLGNDVECAHVLDLSNRLTDATARRNGRILDKDLQKQHYVYDAVGNIVKVRDDALQTYFFRGEVASPTNSFIYDSANRLIHATGREHVGQGNGAPTPYAPSDIGITGPQPGQADAMAAYSELYVYDNASNVTSVIHTGSRGGWTRGFIYEEPNRVVGAGSTSNRLSRISDGSGGQTTTEYMYDSRGNMVRMPHLGGSAGQKNMVYDFQGRLKKLDLGGGGFAYYTYNMAGARVRKVVERSEALVQERLYLGEIELYKETRSGSAVLERETLRVHDAGGLVAIVETRTAGTGTNDQAPRQVVRFQLSSHTSSTSIELDMDANILSFEEYSPYGSTTYQATTTNLETPKRYRFTGKERDEESGLSYHGARYLAPWIARWTSPDPAGLIDGLNLFSYCSANPVSFNDPGGTNGKPTVTVRPHFWGYNAQGTGDSQMVVTIDETPAVDVQTESGEPLEGAFERASSSEYKSFELLEFNSRKGNMEVWPTGPKRTSFAVESLAEKPELIFSRTFAELEELDMINKAAVEHVGPPTQGETATAYKGRINNRILRIIRKAGLGKQMGQMTTVERAAAVVRKALEVNKIKMAIVDGEPQLIPGEPMSINIPKEEPPAPKPPASEPPPPEPVASLKALPEAPAVSEGPVAPEVLVTGSKGSITAGGVANVGMIGFFGLGAAGRAKEDLQQRRTGAAITEVGSFTLLTAAATKIPYVGTALLPVGL
ncbi:SpvB-domain-containing protein, partial [Glonium stellatum]